MNEQEQRRMLRRIERQQGFGAGGQMGLVASQAAKGLPAEDRGAFPTAREIAEEEQDRQRTALAARLLEIVLEDAGWQPLRRRLDGETSAKEAIGDFEILAEAAVAAATVIYPELPSVDTAQESGSGTQEPRKPSPIGEGESGYHDPGSLDVARAGYFRQAREAGAADSPAPDAAPAPLFEDSGIPTPAVVEREAREKGEL